MEGVLQSVTQVVKAHLLFAAVYPLWNHKNWYPPTNVPHCPSKHHTLFLPDVNTANIAVQSLTKSSRSNYLNHFIKSQGKVVFWLGS